MILPDVALHRWNWILTYDQGADLDGNLAQAGGAAVVEVTSDGPEPPRSTRGEGAVVSAWLPPPADDPRGPDGQGRNRLSIVAGWRPAGQCSLWPAGRSSLWALTHGRRPRWGDYQPCEKGRGGCEGCPVLADARKPLERRAFTDRILVRIDDRGRPHLMNRPDRGWSEWGELWSWFDLARLTGWTVGRPYRDQYGEGFWLERGRRGQG